MSLPPTTPTPDSAGQPEKIPLFVSAGQSNESGRGWPEPADIEAGIPQVTTLGNDYVWKQLEEPADSAEGQVDKVSEDTKAGHSSLVRLGKLLYATTGRPLTIIPCSRGSSSIVEWQPPAERFDRSTLFGSADYRIDQAIRAGRELTAFLWYQGENDTGRAELRENYVARHRTMVDTFRRYYGDKPFIYSQLGAHIVEADNYHFIREQQRRMEWCSGYAEAIPGHYMVVTHDLSLLDIVHLDTAGQLALAERRALVIRRFVYGENINATGPRLVSITRPSPTTIKVKTTATINDHDTYENYFTVFVAGTAATIAALGRDPADKTAVLITLAEAPAGPVTVQYQPPVGRPLGKRLENVVKDEDGLPLPAFGPIGLFE